MSLPTHHHTCGKLSAWSRRPLVRVCTMVPTRGPMMARYSWLNGPSGREELVPLTCCSLGLKFISVPSCDTSGSLEHQLWWTLWTSAVLVDQVYSFDNFESLDYVCNSFSLLWYGNPFVSGTSRVACRWTCPIKSVFFQMKAPDTWRILQVWSNHCFVK